MIKIVLKQNIQKIMLIIVVIFFIMMVLLTQVLAVALPPEVKPVGSGTKDDPYIVSSGSNLVWVSKNNTSNGGFVDKYFVQTADITFSGQLRPIGEDDNNPFYGNYDGNGHVITCNTLNTINENVLGKVSYFLGLFGDNAGTIKNLGVDEKISGTGEFVGGLAAENDGTIINCYVKGTTNSKIVNKSIIYHGELVGYNTGSITSCYATGIVNAEQGYTYNQSKAYVGELVGKNDGEISNSYSKGKIIVYINDGSNAQRCFYTGGLIGQNGDGGILTGCYSAAIPILNLGDICNYNNGGLVCENSGKIKNCYAICDVNGKDTGGLVTYNSGTIFNSYATGNVSSNYWNDSMVGGLVGENIGGIIKNCFSTGVVEVSKQGCKFGGLIGCNYNSGSSICNCYYVDKSGTDGVGINNGTITKCIQKAELPFYKALSTYTTVANWDSSEPWDFTNTWLINEANNGYPQLISFCSKVSGVKLDKTALTIVRGETGILKAALSPDNVYNAKLIWKSSNDKLVSVSNNNDSTATLTTDPNSSGNAIITVTTVDGGFSANCSVTVDNPKVSLPIASVVDGNVNIGTKIYLSSPTKNTVFYYTLDGTTPTKNSLKYNDSITINNSLTLKVIGVCENMYDSDVFTVNYTAVPGVSKVEFDTHSISLVHDTKNPTTIKPTFTIYPSNAFNKNVTFLSSDTDIADVDSNGVVTGKKIGSAMIIIKTVDGGFTDVCKISVTPKSIATASEFAKIGVDTEYLASYSYVLINDIDLSECDSSISERAFTGSFDGNGHSISNINSNLFKSNSGVIENLKVDGNITISDNSIRDKKIQGVISNTNSGIIRHCSSKVQINISMLSGGSYYKNGVKIYIGGIVGTGSNILYCDNQGSIKVFDDNDCDWCSIGGIVGCGKDIVGCMNKGDITFNNSSISLRGSLEATIGGIAGSCNQYNDKIDQCCNYGNLHAIVQTTPGLIYLGVYGSRAVSSVGGICGNGGLGGSTGACSECGGSISNSFNYGEVISEANNNDLNNNPTGGKYANVARADGIGGSANNCYNIGGISSSIAGNSASIAFGNVTNSYCINSSTSSASGAIVKTDAELKRRETYTGFDFVNIWAINSNINNGYPYLVSINTASLRPTIVSGVTISNSKSNELDLTWSAVSGVNSYKIYRSSSATGNFLQIGTSSVASYNDKNLMTDTTYYYKVSAVNVYGEGMQSTIVGKTTLKPYYSVNIGTTIGGTIVSDVQSAVYGTTVNLKVTPNTGMRLKTGTLKYNDGVKDFLISGTSFVMPKANVMVIGQFEETLECPKYGDLNNDGVIDYKDYTCLKDYILGKINSFPAQKYISVRNVADLDGDGKVTSIDAAYLNRYLHKIITKFLVEK